MTRAELLEALMVERQDQTWWIAREVEPVVDDDLATARRRREMAADFEALDRPERKAT